MNNRETLESFQSITGADEATARCFLESSNWNLEAGISTFFDHGGVSPAAAVVTAPSLGKSDHTKKKKTLYRSGSGGGWPAKRDDEKDELARLKEDYQRLHERLALYERREREQQERELEEEEARRELEEEERDNRSAAAVMVPVPIDPEERRRARQAYRQLAARPRDGDVGLWSNRQRDHSKLRAGDLQALAHMLGLAMTNAEATRTAQGLATRASGGGDDDDGEDAEQVIPWSRFLRWWAAVRSKLNKQDQKPGDKWSPVNPLAKLQPWTTFLAQARSAAQASTTDGDSGDVTLDVDIDAGTLPFAEAASIRAKLSLDATQAALWREDHRAPSKDSVILSFSFTTDEGVDSFGLGEISGALKDILTSMQSVLQYSSFQVQVKQQQQQPREGCSDGTEKDKAVADEAAARIFRVTLFFADLAPVHELAGLLLLGFEAKDLEASLQFSGGIYNDEETSVHSEESIKASARVRAQLPGHQLAVLLKALKAYRAATNLAGGAVRHDDDSDEDDDHIAKLVTKLRQLALRFEFADLADALRHYIPSLATAWPLAQSTTSGSSTSSSSSSPSSTAAFAYDVGTSPSSAHAATKLTWHSLRQSLCARLAQAMVGAPPPAVAAYSDIVQKLRALDSIHLQCGDAALRVTFDNALLSFLPSIAELTPVIDNLREARSEEAARESLHSQNVRLVFMGDDTVGKTSYLITATEHAFPLHAPMMNENRELSLAIDGRTVCVSLWDSMGVDSYRRLRALAAGSTDMFVICFAVDDPESYASVRSKWVPEVQTHSKPFIILALKTDLRRVAGSSVITEEEGRKLAEDVGAQGYAEASAQDMSGLPMPILESYRARMKFLSSGPSDGAKRRIRTKGRRLSVTFE